MDGVRARAAPSAAAVARGDRRGGVLIGWSGPCCHGDGNGFGSVRRAIRRALRVWRKQLLIWSLTPCETDIWINCAQTCLYNTPRRGTPCMIVSMWTFCVAGKKTPQKIRSVSICVRQATGWVSNKLKVNAVKWLCLEQPAWQLERQHVAS